MYDLQSAGREEWIGERVRPPRVEVAVTAGSGDDDGAVPVFERKGYADESAAVAQRTPGDPVPAARAQVRGDVEETIAELSRGAGGGFAQPRKRLRGGERDVETPDGE